MSACQPPVVSPPTSLYYKNIQIKNTQMKNMKYLPIKEKTLRLPVDNWLLFFVLALLALKGEQAKRGRQSSSTESADLPVIPF